MELIVSHPSAGPVVGDYLAADAKALDFFGGHFTSFDAFAEKARRVDGRFDRAARERAVEAIITPEGADPARLEHFVEQGGCPDSTAARSTASTRRSRPCASPRLSKPG